MEGPSWPPCPVGAGGHVGVPTTRATGGRQRLACAKGGPSQPLMPVPLCMHAQGGWRGRIPLHVGDQHMAGL